MGAIAELIKTAEEDEQSDFRKALEQLQEQASAPVGEEALAALQKAELPTAQEESRRRMWKWVLGAGGGALALGALLRAAKAVGESARHKELLREFDASAGVPGREVTIPIPGKKKASVEKSAAIWPWAVGGAALAPSVLHGAGESVGSAWEKGKESVGKGYEHLFQPTGTALTHPWTLPIGLITSLAALAGGYKITDALLEKLKERRRKRELAEAQSAFERAISSQFSTKSSSWLGAALDGVATAYATGELEKQAATLPKPPEEEGWWDKLRGSGNVATGGYLALLTLLSLLGAAGGYHWVRSREVPRRKYEATKELLLRRQLATPPTVTVDTGE